MQKEKLEHLLKNKIVLLYNRLDVMSKLHSLGGNGYIYAHDTDENELQPKKEDYNQ